jgi:Rrf2 family protein
MDLWYDRGPRAKDPGGSSVHVNQTAQYALRALMHLSSLPEGSTARARDLSGASGIPPAYLSKIMRRLVTGGLLRARKGHGGGFALARRLDRIRLCDVLEASGGGLERDVCIFGVGRCDSADPCPLHDSWSQLNEAFHSWAKKMTLADLRPGPRKRRARARRGARSRR